MNKELEKLKKKCKKIFDKMDSYNLNDCQKPLKELLSEVESLKIACKEEVQYIKAQTIRKDNSKQMMEQAKQRLIALSERLKQIKPFISSYENSLVQINKKLKH